MIIQMKLKSAVHPALDELLRQNGLELQKPFLNLPISNVALYGKIQTPEKDLQSEYELRSSLRMCEDVSEIIDDFENSEPV